MEIYIEGFFFFSFRLFFGVMFAMRFSEKCSRGENAFCMERLVKAATTKGEKNTNMLKLLMDESQAPSITVLIFAKVNSYISKSFRLFLVRFKNRRTEGI